jgi:hypothetical protein
VLSLSGFWPPSRDTNFQSKFWRSTEQKGKQKQLGQKYARFGATFKLECVNVSGIVVFQKVLFMFGKVSK